MGERRPGGIEGHGAPPSATVATPQMKRLCILVVLLAACSPASEPTTTTRADDTLSTTTTRLESTTTTTTPEPECTERDGALRTDRGFVCPPHLSPVVLVGIDAVVSTHLPGRYETQLFSPALTFSRDDPFPTSGESTALLHFDEQTVDCPGAGQVCRTHGSRMSIWSGEAGRALASLPTLTPVDGTEGWVADLTVTEIEVGGFPATQTIFTVDCGTEDPPFCEFEMPVMVDFPQASGIHRGWIQFDDHQTAIIDVAVPEQPLTIYVEAPSSRFDAYWDEVVAPVLESLEFETP
jgi:hypothetical protein